MPGKLSLPIARTLETGSLTTQYSTDGPCLVELTGTFGSVVLSSSISALAERTIVAAERFVSEMPDMLFTLTGTGPIVVTVTPLSRDTGVVVDDAA